MQISQEEVEELQKEGQPSDCEPWCIARFSSQHSLLFIFTLRSMSPLIPYVFSPLLFSPLFDTITLPSLIFVLQDPRLQMPSSAPSSPRNARAVPSPTSIIQQLSTLSIPSGSPNNSPRGLHSSRGSPAACVPSTPSFSPRSPISRSNSYLHFWCPLFLPCLPPFSPSLFFPSLSSSLSFPSRLLLSPLPYLFSLFSLMIQRDLYLDEKGKSMSISNIINWRVPLFFSFDLIMPLFSACILCKELLYTILLLRKGRRRERNEYFTIL